MNSGIEERVEKLEKDVGELKKYIEYALDVQQKLTASMEESIRKLVGWLPGMSAALDPEMEKQQRLLRNFEKRVRGLDL